MSTYADELGIDLVELEAERHHHYETPTPKYISGYITPPPESTDDWQPITRSANQVGYHVETVRRWTHRGYVRHEKRSGRTYVYYPDVIRHARNPKPRV